MVTVEPRRLATKRELATAHHRADLQGLRAVAVLAVFSDHLFGWPAGGFVGVDVFFVLSGFLITGMLLRERTTTHEVSFRHFYVRRAKRILPSALLVLTVTVLCAHLVFPAGRAKQTFVDALYAAVFSANFRFEALGADYFQQNLPPSPIQHYWSLSVEEQFYFVWPALLVGIFALTRGRRRRIRPHSVRRCWLLGSMLAIVALSFWWALHLSASDPNAAYFSSLTRVWELGVGAVVAIAAPWLAGTKLSARIALSYTGLTGIVCAVAFIDGNDQFPAPWAALPVVSSALIVASFVGAPPVRVPLFTNAVARYVGDTSYTLYLWHWPVIILLDSVMDRTPAYFGSAVALSAVLTAVTYHFYENPIRKSEWLSETTGSRYRPAKRLGDGAWGLVGATAAAVVVMSILWINAADRQALVRKEIEAALAVDTPVAELTPSEADLCVGALAMSDSKCRLWDPNLPIRPSADQIFDDLPVEASRCYTPSYQNMLTCDFGDMSDGSKRIALVGDSHATFLIPAIRPLLNSNKWRLTTFTGHECMLMEPLHGGCERAMKEVRAALLKDRFDLILVTNFNNNQDPVAFRRAWDPLVAAGKRLAVIADNPQTSKEALSCVARTKVGGSANLGVCGVAASAAFPNPDPLIVAARSMPTTGVIDLRSYYCAADRCPSIIGNVAVYRDTNHITATYSKSLARPMEQSLRNALAPPIAR
ncbi:hypothetical protein EB72_15460 [Mycobacterium sp. SWH-M1]|nr:hypothetical protein EB72_15460 [Mycobacterium sp. SWH-M1]